MDSYLILLNGPYEYSEFFGALGRYFEDKGNKVYFACSGHRFVNILSDEFIKRRCYIYSDYSSYNDLLKNSENLIESTWGELYYSDIERSLAYKIPIFRDPIFWKNNYFGLRKFFSNIIKSNKIDVIVYESVSNSFSICAYLEAMSNKVQFLSFQAAKIPGRFEVQTTIAGESDKIFLRYEEYSEETEYETKIINNIFDNFMTISPDYMKYNRLSEKNLFKNILTKKKLNNYLTW